MHEWMNAWMNELRMNGWMNKKHYLLWASNHQRIVSNTLSFLRSFACYHCIHSTSTYNRKGRQTSEATPPIYSHQASYLPTELPTGLLLYCTYCTELAWWHCLPVCIVWMYVHPLLTRYLPYLSILYRFFVLTSYFFILTTAYRYIETRYL